MLRTASQEPEPTRRAGGVPLRASLFWEHHVLNMVAIIIDIIMLFRRSLSE